MESIHPRNAIGNRVARFSGRASPEEGVYYDAGRIEPRESFARRAKCAYVIDSCRSFSDRVWGARLDGFDNGDIHATARELTRDNPTVAAIVSRSREYECALAQTFRVAPRDLSGR